MYADNVVNALDAINSFTSSSIAIAIKGKIKTNWRKCIIVHAVWDDLLINKDDVSAMNIPIQPTAWAIFVSCVELYIGPYKESFTSLTNTQDDVGDADGDGESDNAILGGRANEIRQTTKRYFC